MTTPAAAKSAIAQVAIREGGIGSCSGRRGDGAQKRKAVHNKGTAFTLGSTALLLRLDPVDGAGPLHLLDEVGVADLVLAVDVHLLRARIDVGVGADRIGPR